MAINRFTKYTAPQFVQAYDPYPVQQMMGLAQHQQRRFDQIDTAIGKAYSDAVIKPGLSVEGRRTAAAVNKERKEQLDSLVNDFYENRNVRGAVRGLSELSSNWKSDTRADFVNADRELMKPILTQSGQEGYGEYMTHKSLNPTTGEHTLGYTDEQIAAGVAPTLADYGVMSNPGSSSAFKASYIDPVKARIEQGFSVNEKGERITTTNKELTVDRFLEQVTPDLGRLSSNGVSLDQLSDAPPELQQFILWKKNEYSKNGQDYTLGSLTADYITEVKKYTNEVSTDKVKALTKAERMQIQAAQGSGLTDRMFELGDINDRVVNEIYHKEGLDGIAKELGYAENVEGMLELSLAPNALAASKEERHNILVESSVKRQMAKAQSQIDPRNGEVIPIDENLIKSKAEDEAVKQEKMLDKVYQLKIKSLQNLQNDSQNPNQAMFKNTTIDKDGNFLLAPEKQKVLDEKLEGAEIKSLSYEIDLINKSLNPLFGREDFKKNYPNIAEVVEIGSVLGTTDLSIYDVDDKSKRKKIIEEFKTLKKDRNFLKSAVGFYRTIGKSNEELFEQLNKTILTSEDSYNQRLSYEQEKVRKQFDPNYLVEKELNEVVKDYYGNRNYHTNQMTLYDKDAVGVDKYTVAADQILSSTAKGFAKDPTKLYANGEKIPFDKLEDKDFAEELGIENVEIGLGDLAFDPESVEVDYVATDKGYKVFAKGYFTIEKGQKVGESTIRNTARTTKQYQVDITNTFMGELSGSEKARLHYADMITDKAYAAVKGVAQGESIYLNDTQSKAARDVLGGDTEILYNNDGTYTLKGKVPTYDENGNIKIVSTDQNDSDYDVDAVKELSGMSLSQLGQRSTEIASTVGWLTNQNQTSVTTSQKAAMDADPSITSVDEVETFKTGLFGLDSKENDNFEQQYRIGFAKTISETVPVEEMTVDDQIRYSSKLFTNGGGGWNQWDVTKRAADGSFENKKFDKMISTLKSVDRNKINDPNYISNFIQSADKTSLITPETVANVMRNFNKDMLQVNNSLYRTSSLARTEGLNDALIALALISADSNFDSSNVKAVAK
jgi:hypothetical protein